MERLPSVIRGFLGLCAACLAVGITYSIEPLRGFPLLLAFPTVILTSWFLGMWGGIACALTDAVLVDMFLTRPQVRLSIGNAREELRMTVFLVVTILLGWSIRRLAQQRAQLGMQGLRERLSLADAERKLAEERARASEAVRERDELLQIALESNGMGLWVWDLERGTNYWSDEKYRMIGQEPGSIEPSTESWLRFVHPDDANAVRDALWQTREGGKDYHHQYRVIRPDGTVHWIESQGKCQRDGEGRVLRVMGVNSDVTHRKKAEDAMLRAEKLAVVGRLAASVAHEINNPLEAVANLLYLITLADSTEAAHAQARHALEELMRVSLVTQQTLKFHRQSGMPKVAMLSELVAAVLVLFRGKLAAGVAVDLRVEREMGVTCMPSETQQIFANLISNAVEAMSEHGRLVIRLRPSRDWRDWSLAGMRVTFCDTGVGMDRVTMRRIFEPFFTTKLETGTGLGMWVVSQLVERQRGRVNVWSTQREGRSGTAFSVFLPFADGTNGAIPAEVAQLQTTLTR